ncbi:MAG: hypothetical protein R3C45_11540 [Phycisphaerales bacterium]
MLWQSLSIAFLLTAAAAVAYCVWLLAERRAPCVPTATIANDLAQRETAIEGYLDQVEQLEPPSTKKPKPAHRATR